MEYFYAVMLFLGGIGAFLVGCNLLSDAIKSLANKKIRNLLNKTSKSKIVSCGIGAIVTAAVQSSGLTTVMIVGLVNSGLMTLYQATAIIMGANIGTTITAQIAALQAFDVAKIAIGFVGVGAFMNIFSKKDNVKAVGNIVTAVGLVFLGLEVMSDAMYIVKNSAWLVNLLSSLENPVLLLLIGIIFTAIVQSSSAITTIVISMVGAGMVIGGGGNAVLFIVLGSNIGSCVTALISSVGAGANAKRASLIHLMFNVVGSVIFFIILLVWKNFMSGFMATLFSEPSTQVAMFHTIFNVICTCLFLPFTKVFVTISKKIIKDTDKSKRKSYLDERLLVTPSVAINAAYREVEYFLSSSVTALETSVKGFTTADTSLTKSVFDITTELSSAEKDMTDYLTKVSAKALSVDENNKISALYSNLSDIQRVGELAENITKYTRKSVDQNLVFSSSVMTELNEMLSKIKDMTALTSIIISSGKIDVIKTVEEIEEEVDGLRKLLVKEHLDRLNKGECRAESSGVFINLVSNLERAADHIDYVAHSVTV